MFHISAPGPPLPLPGILRGMSICQPTADDTFHFGGGTCRAKSKGMAAGDTEGKGSGLVTERLSIPLSVTADCILRIWGFMFDSVQIP